MRYEVEERNEYLQFLHLSKDSWSSVPISFRGVFRIELNIYDKTSLGKEFAILKDIAILP